MGEPARRLDPDPLAVMRDSLDRCAAEAAAARAVLAGLGSADARAALAALYLASRIAELEEEVRRARGAAEEQSRALREHALAIVVRRAADMAVPGLAPPAAAAPEVPPSPARPRHRAPGRRQQRHLRPVERPGQGPVPALIPAAAFAGLLKGALRHSWAAHPVAAAAAPAVALTLAGAVTLAPASRTLEFRTAPPASLNLHDARPAAPPALPPPHRPPPAALARQHHPYAGRHRRPAPPPAPEPPAASPTPPPSPPPAPAPAGTLTITGEQLLPGPGGQAVLGLTAEGGPVLWSAAASAGITLDVTRGGLQAGGTAQIQVTVGRPLMLRPGSGWVDVDGQRIPVRWGPAVSSGRAAYAPAGPGGSPRSP